MRPAGTSIPSYIAVGKLVASDISTTSILLTVKAVFAQKLPKSPGCDVITF